MCFCGVILLCQPAIVFATLTHDTCFTASTSRSTSMMTIIAKQKIPFLGL